MALLKLRHHGGGQYRANSFRRRKIHKWIWIGIISVSVVWLLSLATLISIGGLTRSSSLYMSKGLPATRKKGKNTSTQSTRRQISSFERVLVLISQPVNATYEALMGTVRDALFCEQSDVVVYATSQTYIDKLQTAFNGPIQQGRLSMYRAETMETDVLGQDFVNDMNLAYLLDLSTHEPYTIYNFTLVLQTGMRLNVTYRHSWKVYTKVAIEHYKYIDEMRIRNDDWNRTCWTTLSSSPIPSSTMPASFFENKEHASRMAMLLRSVLPYRRVRAAEILSLHYCKRFLWQAQVMSGPPLFYATDTQPQPNATVMDAQSQPHATAKPFLNVTALPLPKWVDPTQLVGPRFETLSPPFKVAFGVTTMKRPQGATGYLTQFMKELLHIVQHDFAAIPTSSFYVAGRHQAVIVLMVSGNSIEEIRGHHSYLETNYKDAISNGIVRLVDAPIRSYGPLLQNMRLTYGNESSERRYWRSKQNLDISSLWNATAGLSSYVMVLEDDTGFQSGFAANLIHLMNVSSLRKEYGIPQWWSMSYYGFGYSGILIHASDVRVYQHLHHTFYDEKPCDLLWFSPLIRSGRTNIEASKHDFSNGKNSFLRHYGKYSTLPGKQQEVW